MQVKGISTVVHTLLENYIFLSSISVFVTVDNPLNILFSEGLFLQSFSSFKTVRSVEYFCKNVAVEFLKKSDFAV